MKRFKLYIAALILLQLIYFAACTESKQPANPCTYDTLSITSGKANRIIISSSKTQKYLATLIMIQDSAGKILAYKQSKCATCSGKDGWNIQDAEAALEVLIADLENCKQGKK